jgi:hypothetical protein
MIGMVLNMPPFCTRLAIPVNVGGQFGAENVKVEIDISEGSPLTWPGWRAVRILVYVGSDINQNPYRCPIGREDRAVHRMTLGLRWGTEPS